MALRYWIHYKSLPNGGSNLRSNLLFRCSNISFPWCKRERGGEDTRLPTKQTRTQVRSLVVGSCLLLLSRSMEKTMCPILKTRQSEHRFSCLAPGQDWTRLFINESLVFFSILVSIFPFFLPRPGDSCGRKRMKGKETRKRKGDY